VLFWGAFLWRWAEHDKRAGQGVEGPGAFEGGTSDLLWIFCFIVDQWGTWVRKFQENQSFDQNDIPFVMISKSGGARMMEATVLMQLAKRP
jgi:hypothetical protein